MNAYNSGRVISLVSIIVLHSCAAELCQCRDECRIENLSSSCSSTRDGDDGHDIPGADVQAAQESRAEEEKGQDQQIQDAAGHIFRNTGTWI